MADEIKIQLSTYLKDTGIKATDAQIEKLAKKVVKANKDAQASTEQFGGAIGNMEGPMGKLQKVIGGVTGKAMALIAAFKTGWDIGTWINEKVVTPLFGIKDPIEELKKQNREIEKQWKQASDAFDEAMAKWEQGWQAQIDGADKAIKKVENVTAAYLRMQQAREKVQSAKDDAAMLGMERDKFNAMATAGTPEEAAAAGKYHDVLIAEAKQKQELAKYDREAEASEKRRVAAQEAYAASRNKVGMIEKQLEEAKRNEAQLDTQQAVRQFGWEKSEEKYQEAVKTRQRLEKDLSNARVERGKRLREKQALDVEAGATEQARQNLQERTQLEIDERKKAFDEYCDYVAQQEQQAADEEWRRQQEEIAKRVAEEKSQRMRMEQELAQQRMADLRAELSEAQRDQGNAAARQSAAAGGLSRAWGWYRNQSSMQAVIDEQKEQAEAERQWQKDFDRLKFRRSDWRTAEFGSLSAADEAVRQVALAKEEKEAADKAVIETAENTRKLSEKLDELLAVKG